MEGLGLLVAVTVGFVATGGNPFASRKPVTHAAPVVTKADLNRPKALGGSVPTGQDARDLRPFDAWIDHPDYVLTPRAVQSIFRLAEQGFPQRQCDLIDDLIEHDATLRNLFEQRERSVAGKPWVVQSDGSDGDSEKAARVLGAALRQLPMVEVLQHLLSFNRYGWACVEIEWGLMPFEGQTWIVPVWLTCVPARRFVISQGLPGTGNIGDLRLYTDPSNPWGDELRPGKWIVLRRPGAWLARSGLMRTAARPALAKRYAFRHWLRYSERFGLPMPIATYKEGADPTTISVAKEIVANIGSDRGAVKSDGVTIDFANAQTKGGDNSKTHGGLIAFCNAEMAKLVNGSTLANDNAGSGGASYALGEVHDTVRWDQVLADNELLQEAVRNQLAASVTTWNNLRGAPAMLKVQIVRDLEPKVRASIAVQLKNELGIDVSISQMQQELGFRAPTNDADKAPGLQVANLPGVAGGLPV